MAVYLASSVLGGLRTLYDKASLKRRIRKSENVPIYIVPTIYNGKCLYLDKANIDQKIEYITGPQQVCMKYMSLPVE
jgi:hypothetical protein